MLGLEADSGRTAALCFSHPLPSTILLEMKSSFTKRDGEKEGGTILLWLGFALGVECGGAFTALVGLFV